jgi:hypothetical protein
MVTSPTDSEPRMTALARASNDDDRPVLSSESAPYQQNRNCLTVIKPGRKPHLGAIFKERLAD